MRAIHGTITVGLTTLPVILHYGYVNTMVFSLADQFNIIILIKFSVTFRYPQSTRAIGKVVDKLLITLL